MFASQARTPYRSQSVQVGVSAGSTSTACQTEGRPENFSVTRKVECELAGDDRPLDAAASDSASDVSEHDADNSPDFELASDESDCERDDLSRLAARKLVLQIISGNPMRYIGVHPTNMFIVDLLAEKNRYQQKK